MGLGGLVREVATERLQRGDRVLFYTDGVTEMRSPEGKEFGTDRLADFLVRATLDRVSPAETVRRLSASVVAYNEEGRTDDATLMLLEYHGPPRQAVSRGSAQVGREPPSRWMVWAVIQDASSEAR